MAKFQKSQSGLKKIDIFDIEVLENSRKSFVNIEELAGSIKAMKGLLEPIIVEPKPGGGYILTAGERRLRAHKLLVKNGEPYTQIEALIKIGDRELIQLTENINRENLTASELEAALMKMIDSGMSQTDISERLNKRIQWVSDILAAGKSRERAEAAGVDTEGLSSSAMSTLRKATPEQVKIAKNNGGTLAAAKEAAGCGNVDKVVDNFPMKKGDILFDGGGREVARVTGKRKIKWTI